MLQELGLLDDSLDTSFTRKALTRFTRGRAQPLEHAGVDRLLEARREKLRASDLTTLQSRAMLPAAINER